MSTVQVKRRLPLMSLSLLLVAYVSFGWHLLGSDVPRSLWLLKVCGFLIERFNFASAPVESAYCQQFVWQNWGAVVLAVIWIILSALAFRSPITSFSRLVVRWFQSETVAFLSIFLMAGLATVILFWLDIFLYILTILATEALARIDIQLAGYGITTAFWILVLVSYIGLGIGVAIQYFY